MERVDLVERQTVNDSPSPLLCSYGSGTVAAVLQGTFISPL